MNGQIDAERILDAYLAPEADRLPDRVLDAALADIARTPQRRALRVPWRFPNMHALSRATGIAAVALVAVVGAGALFYLTSNRPGGAGRHRRRRHRRRRRADTGSIRGRARDHRVEDVLLRGPWLHGRLPRGLVRDRAGHTQVAAGRQDPSRRVAICGHLHQPRTGCCGRPPRVGDASRGRCRGRGRNRCRIRWRA